MKKWRITQIRYIIGSCTVGLLWISALADACYELLGSVDHVTIMHSGIGKKMHVSNPFSVDLLSIVLE